MLALAGGVVAGFVTAGLTVRVGATEAGVLAATDGTTDAAAPRDGAGDGVYGLGTAVAWHAATARTPEHASSPAVRRAR